METRTVHSKEEALAQGLPWLFKGMGDTLKMWRETTCALIYHHWTGEKKGQEYVSTQHLGWASYELTPLPGCHGILVSHDSHIEEDKRGFGLGSYFHKERLELARVAERSCMICTVDANNIVERRILFKNNWEMVHTFLNKDTNNNVEIWVKNL